MSGYNAFLSFANYMRDALAGQITVIIEKREDEAVVYPYLLLQDGPDFIDRWLSSCMIQGWLVVRKEDDKPLVETLGRALDKVIAVSKDPGQLVKYDYSVTPAVESGALIPSISEVSQIMDSPKDSQVLRRVVTWELKSNNS